MNIIRSRSAREWLSSLPVVILLLCVIVAGNSENIHSQLLKTGELLWKDYFILRSDIPTPDCHQNPDMEAELDRLAGEAAAEDDGLGLFGDEVFDRQAAAISLKSATTLCRAKYQMATDNRDRVTTSVKAFRSIEKSVAAVSLLSIELKRITFLVLLFICAFTSSVARHHIAFRPMITRMDHRVSSVAQLLGNIILTVSAWNYRNSIFASGTMVDYAEIYSFTIAGFFLLTCISAYQLIVIPKDAKPKGDIVKSLSTIPLYIIMAFITGNYFFLTEGHAAGVAIFFSTLFEQSDMFLNIGLYIWVGMLLKQTRLGELVFNVFKPWQLPPELLAFVAIVVMAVPTAYTGASGIIIIAMGVVVYDELRRVGTRRQLAFAATAMTGSSGVVLRPCLLIVIIAAFNKEVVTDQLYGWGFWIFLLTAIVFFFYAFLTKKEKLKVRPAGEALRPCLLAFKPLIPYVLIFVFIGLIYAFLMDAYLDEFSAPIMLPVIIIAVLAYEKISSKSVLAPPEESAVDVGHRVEYKPDSFEESVRLATTETTVHIGALLLLMGVSFAVAGVIDRSGLFANLPETFGSIWVTMGFLIVVLVGIGMIMDPFGAVVLVSGTVAQIAYQNGVHPVHFWMLTLVAFELGYLSPPVALNHLLTRQVVGEEEAARAVEDVVGESFWYRHERVLLPLVVMGTTLLIVAIMPLAIGYR